MDKNKAHGYCTRRNKTAILEENYENVNLMSPSLSKRKLIESPSGNKLCILSGYASPPCRPVPLSQNNENEIEWDLTSPSARKYHVLLSDKKTSTPTQTPTRKRELRPRVALCKKNIALTVDRSGDLINELAALNDLVNTEQAQSVMTPSCLIQMPCGPSSPIPTRKESAKPNDQSTSEIFDDDSFFSESLLLCTQAIEQEALNEPEKNERELNHATISSSSSELSISRKSFDLDLMDSEALEPSITTVSDNKVMKPKLAVKHPTPVNSTSKRITSNCKSPSNISPVKNQSFQNSYPKPVVKSVNNHTSKDSTLFTKPPPPSKQILQASSTKLSSNQSSKPLKSPPQLLRSAVSLGITRLKDPPTSTTQKRLHITNVPLQSALPVVVPPPKNTCCNLSNDLFDDDDDDLLIAVANEVESQYVSSTSDQNFPTREDEDDDGFFQPEVLDFISQIETQAITKKTTAELLEEKRQAAIQRRQQRLNRH